jgi:hypothetical protein
MPVYSVEFTDNFNRANSGDLGANWDAGYSSGAAWQIVGNAIRATTVDTLPFETVNAVSLSADQWASVRLSVAPDSATTQLFSILLRVAAPTTRTLYDFQCRTSGATTRIMRTIAGAEIQLVSAGIVTWAANDVARAEIYGGHLYFYQNSTLLCSVSDHVIASGRAGLQAWISNPDPVSILELDDFQCGNVTTRRLFRGS